MRSLRIRIVGRIAGPYACSSSREEGHRREAEVRRIQRPLWESGDEPLGGIGGSQYDDCVLSQIFVYSVRSASRGSS